MSDVLSVDGFRFGVECGKETSMKTPTTPSEEKFIVATINQLNAIRDRMVRLAEKDIVVCEITVSEVGPWHIHPLHNLKNARDRLAQLKTLPKTPIPQ